eukprot:scaffold120652_cov60-Phaeocystis_antarctica.AAC.1
MTLEENFCSESSATTPCSDWMTRSLVRVRVGVGVRVRVRVGVGVRVRLRLGLALGLGLREGDLLEVEDVLHDVVAWLGLGFGFGFGFGFGLGLDTA